MVTGSFGLMGKLFLEEQNAKDFLNFILFLFVSHVQILSCLKMKSFCSVRQHEKDGSSEVSEMGKYVPGLRNCQPF